MDLITRIMTFLGDVAFEVLDYISPLWALVILSALTGMAMLLIWRHTSNQDAIADVRRQISAHLLASRLFKDDLSVTFRAQRQIIWQALRLMGHSIRPMVIMTVPFVLIMVQIGLRYEFRPMPVGQVTRVKVTMKDPGKTRGHGDQLKLPDGMVAAANDPCRAMPIGTIDWRLTPRVGGTHMLKFGNGDDVIELPVVAGDGFERLSKFRGGSFFQRLLYSAEPSIPDSSAFASIEVFYPQRSTAIAGFDVHWLITLLVLSIVFALIFKPFFKVHI